ncbi:MAG TPA: hypothetical protein VJJ72_02045 [Candidatus Paceibacterota bacterium]
MRQSNNPDPFSWKYGSVDFTGSTKKVTVFIHPSLDVQLEALAKREGRLKKRLVQEAIYHYLRDIKGIADPFHPENSPKP